MNNNALFKQLHTALFLLFCCAAFAQNASTAISFVQNDFEQTKAAAVEEEKLILIKFSARWCMPCKLMDKHVWTNPTLAEYVNANCAALSSDYDSFDAYVLKEQYKVISLPTILILNACGDVLARIEESCNSTQILEKLQQYNKPKNRICKTYPTDTPIDALNPRKNTVNKGAKKETPPSPQLIPKKGIVKSTEKQKVLKPVRYLSKPVVRPKQAKQGKQTTFLTKSPVRRTESADFAVLDLPLH